MAERTGTFSTERRRYWWLAASGDRKLPEKEPGEEPEEEEAFTFEAESEHTPNGHIWPSEQSSSLTHVLVQALQAPVSSSYWQ